MNGEKGKNNEAEIYWKAEVIRINSAPQQR